MILRGEFVIGNGDLIKYCASDSFTDNIIIELERNAITILSTSNSIDTGETYFQYQMHNADTISLEVSKSVFSNSDIITFFNRSMLSKFQFNHICWYFSGDANNKLDYTFLEVVYVSANKYININKEFSLELTDIVNYSFISSPFNAVYASALEYILNAGLYYKSRHIAHYINTNPLSYTNDNYTNIPFLIGTPASSFYDFDLGYNEWLQDVNDFMVVSGKQGSGHGGERWGKFQMRTSGWFYFVREHDLLTAMLIKSIENITATTIIYDYDKQIITMDTDFDSILNSIQRLYNNRKEVLDGTSSGQLWKLFALTEKIGDDTICSYGVMKDNNGVITENLSKFFAINDFDNVYDYMKSVFYTWGIEVKFTSNKSDINVINIDRTIKDIEARYIYDLSGDYISMNCDNLQVSIADRTDCSRDFLKYYRNPLSDCKNVDIYNNDCSVQPIDMQRLFISSNCRDENNNPNAHGGLINIPTYTIPEYSNEQYAHPSYDWRGDAVIMFAIPFNKMPLNCYYKFQNYATGNGLPVLCYNWNKNITDTTETDIWKYNNNMNIFYSDFIKDGFNKGKSNNFENWLMERLWSKFISFLLKGLKLSEGNGIYLKFLMRNIKNQTMRIEFSCDYADYTKFPVKALMEINNTLQLLEIFGDKTFYVTNVDIDYKTLKSKIIAYEM